ncbi:Fic family protein [Rhodococcus phenolicus]|uniref:Fic family protein n=1 Tax=Rhodococcus phenolicus TaxID=263849 RepID=UPI0008308CE6|nr:Fic family protein [Rhodococcus phenolicus]
MTPGDAVAQAVHAQELEGWRPEDDARVALTAFATGTLGRGEYIAAAVAAARAIDPSEQRPRLLRRYRPYYVRGTTVLRNGIGLANPVALAEAEHRVCAARLVEIHLGAVAPGVPLVTSIHQHLFGDVYPWAGQQRIVDLRKGDAKFLPVPHLAARMAALEAGAGTVRPPDFVGPTATILADLVAVHPFREGNGRTATTLLAVLARRAGLPFDLRRIDRTAWMDASRAAMAARDGDHRVPGDPFVPIVERAIGIWQSGSA